MEMGLKEIKSIRTIYSLKASSSTCTKNRTINQDTIVKTTLINTNRKKSIICTLIAAATWISSISAITNNDQITSTRKTWATSYNFSRPSISTL